MKEPSLKSEEVNQALFFETGPKYTGRQIVTFRGKIRSSALPI